MKIKKGNAEGYTVSQKTFGIRRFDYSRTWTNFKKPETNIQLYWVIFLNNIEYFIDHQDN